MSPQQVHRTRSQQSIAAAVFRHSATKSWTEEQGEYALMRLAKDVVLRGWEHLLH